MTLPTVCRKEQKAPPFSGPAQGGGGCCIPDLHPSLGPGVSHATGDWPHPSPRALIKVLLASWRKAAGGLRSPISWTGQGRGILGVFILPGLS